MTNHPQTPHEPRTPVDEAGRSSTPCASPNAPLTWDDAPMSTIHTLYYCYHRFQ